MNTSTKILSILVLLAFLASCRQKENTVDFQLSVPVSVMVLKTSFIEEYINATGTVSPTHEATLVSRIEGDYYLQNNPRTGKPYALGDEVKKGEIIVKLKDDEYKNQIKIESQELNMEISKMEYEKQQSLYDKGGVTLRELKNGEISYVNAKVDYENAQIDLAKMNVSAPFSGMLTDLPYITNGTRISTNTEVVKMMNYTHMILNVNLPEKNYAQVKKGQSVIVTNYSLPDDTLRGTIDQISPSIDPDARTFKIVVNIHNPDYVLLPGMFVKADLVTNREEDAIIIPKEIVKTKGGYSSVFVVKNGAAEERRIRTGISNTTHIMVTSGLETADRVVIKGYETLRNRSKIKILNEEVQASDEEKQESGDEKKKGEQPKRNKR